MTTVSVNGQLIPATAGAKVVYTTADGHYLGSVSFDAVSQEALGIVGKMFAEWCAQQSGGIQVATGMPAGIRTS